MQETSGVLEEIYLKTLTVDSWFCGNLHSWDLGHSLLPDLQTIEMASRPSYLQRLLVRFGGSVSKMVLDRPPECSRIKSWPDSSTLSDHGCCVGATFGLKRNHFNHYDQLMEFAVNVDDEVECLELKLVGSVLDYCIWYRHRAAEASNGSQLIVSKGWAISCSP